MLLDMGYRIYYFNNNIKEMKEITGLVKKGYVMLFATKKELDKQ